MCGPTSSIAAIDRRVDVEAEPLREHHGAQHADRVLLEALDRVADGADDAGFEVLQAADVVDDRAVRGVVEERVDREVAAERVFLGGPVGVVALDEQVGLTVGGGVRLIGADVAPERGHLDRLGAELDVSQPKTAADDPAVTEAAFDLVRLRRGPDVEVLGPSSEEQVSHTAADQERGVAELLEPAHDLECVRVDVAAGESML